MSRDRNRPFEILAREHALALLAYVRSCVLDHAAAEDLAQETFLAAWERLDQYDESIPFACWLRGIAKNKVLAHLRSSAIANKHIRVFTSQRVAAIAREFDQLIPGRGDVSGDTLSALRECLTTLPAPDRDVIRRMYDERQTCRAMATQLGHTVEAIKKRLQRARVQLRECILGKLKTELTHG